MSFRCRHLWIQWPQYPSKGDVSANPNRHSSHKCNIIYSYLSRGYFAVLLRVSIIQVSEKGKYDVGVEVFCIRIPSTAHDATMGDLHENSQDN